MGWVRAQLGHSVEPPKKRGAWVRPWPSSASARPSHLAAGTPSPRAPPLLLHARPAAASGGAALVRDGEQNDGIERRQDGHPHSPRRDVIGETPHRQADVVEEPR